MELPAIGQHCSEPNCKQLDFLPFKCKCEQIFCVEHFTNHTLECPAICHPNQPNLEGTKAEYVCAHPSCTNKSYVPLLCQKCDKHFCVAHRHVVQCSEKDPEVVAEELEKFTAPVREFNNAKMEVDKQLDEKINQARKKAKTQQMANKVQLMRVKNKATGSKGIPSTDRVYFNIYHPRSVGQNKVTAVFVSKAWSLGRVIDAAAEECKVVNKNNQSNALKLRLFHKLTGEILSIDLSKMLSTLLIEDSVIDGEELVLEYVENDCTCLDISN